MNTQLLWYTTRATGVVALILLTGTVMLGVVGTARAVSPQWPRLVTASLHRNLALLSIALVGVHIATSVLDPFVPIGWLAAVIPFSSPYRPLWLSLGAIAFDLLLAVLITSLFRDRLDRRVWHGVHLLVYLSWPVALWHGLGTGTDTKLTWLLGLDAICVAAVCWAVWWRISLTRNPAWRRTALTGIFVIPAATFIFVAYGPLQPGWSARSGTPATLLHSSGTSSPAGSNSGSGIQLSNAAFTGRLAQTNGPSAGEITLTVSGTTTGSGESILIVLHGMPDNGGVSMTDGHVQIGPAGAGWSGPVVQLNGADLVASVTGPAGRRQAQFVLNINGTAASGTVSVVAAAGE